MEIRRAGGVEAESADAVVVGVLADRRVDDAGTWLLGRLPWVETAMAEAEFTGKAGQSFTTTGADRVPYRTVVFAGLGDEPGPEQVRRAAGAAARSLSRSRVIATTLHDAVDGGAEAAGFGFMLGGYRFDRHKTETKPRLTEEVALLGAGEAAEGEARRGVVIASGVAFARDLVNEPAVGKPPEALAEQARLMAEEYGLGVRILDEDDIAAERLGGLRGVAMGATNPARLVELRWEPDEPTGFLAFVGKGIVFDSGGLSIKPSEGMETMKTDMSGAAAVFAAVRVIAQLELPVRVLAIAPLTENMIGGAAMRPGDVLVARNGKTIEVLNTDAEGRLILADGLSLAAEAAPDLIVDVATLTGACKVALGVKIAGIMGSDGAVDRVSRAAEAAGERVWRLPLPEDYRSDIDSEVADMKNTGTKFGGAITAALLLREFVDGHEWAHLDIAGPARSGESDHYIAKGGTGFGVRTLVELARQTARR
jgi:leucyl aminopeptidase